MIGASKILTVSYGTFSCTLEGFDDPFNTMKAIAEYFRDLAAEDRYFGAEPPTPDAAMLHRIAERQSQRRVVARVDDHGMTFRAETPAAAVPVVTPPATMPDGVASRLARIRAAVAEAEEAARNEDDAVPVAATSDLARLFAVEALADVSPADDGDAMLAALRTSHVADDSEDLPALAEVPGEGDLVRAAMAEDEGVSAAVPTKADHADDLVLAALAALDRVETTAEQPAESPAGQTFADAIPVFPDDETIAEDDDLLFLDSLDATEIPDPSTTAAAAVKAPVGGNASGPETRAEMPLADAAAAADADPAPVAEADPGETDPAPETQIEAAPVAVEPVAVQPFEAEPVSAKPVDFEPIGAEPGETEPGETELVETAPTAVALTDKAQRARARIIRIRRSAAAAAPAPAEAATDGTAPFTTPQTDAPIAEIAAGGAGLPADAQADNSPAAASDQNLSAALSAILTDSTHADAIKADIRTPSTGTPDTRTSDTRTSDAGTPDAGTPDSRTVATAPVEDAAVSRLMEQTQSEMAVPENRRRLSAIAHLKAAVAATVAERLRFGRARAEDPEAKRSEAYRDDLARVVRPRRPEPAPDRATARNDTPTAAGDKTPLVLVSSQRIDRPTPAAPQPVAPVRPRRISGAAASALLDAEMDGSEDRLVENIFTDTRGFAEFADNVGAHGLPDLIEAAAAYAAAFEGRDQFTRPQLMRQVETAAGELAREDGLRSFGALLRDGRIVKVTRGRFAVTENSRYLAEARKLAG